LKIASYIKNSLIDYPQKIAAVVFSAKCNMNCWYCQNFELIRPSSKNCYEEFMFFLKKRVGQIEGVVITGGEPTLNNDLEQFIKKIKSLGYLVKLDTNGLKPEVLEKLLNENLLDYVAMDVKAPLHEYEQIARVKIDLTKLIKSINLLKNSNIDYEFRTTLSPDLTLDNLEEIAKMLAPCKNFSLQNYQKPIREEKLITYTPHSKNEILKGYEIIKKYIPNAKLKGV